MDIKVWMYVIYLAVSVGLTIWVARALSRNGQVFLEEVFAEERLARAVNSLLVVGFYLLNLGYVTVAMKHSDPVDSTSQAMEELSLKIGLVLLVLGALHFFNVFALGRYRRNRLRQLATHPPIAPIGRLPMPFTPPGAQLVGAYPGGPQPTGGYSAGPHAAGPQPAGPQPAGPQPGAGPTSNPPTR
ncbi:hypothetical protein DDE19_07850 [Micromonospora ureilytica]|uniref:Uncharacterized protein n=1 Tax=Micromonospora ureilytica TaxID=709868 RepID=A0A3N9YEG3_9ACTN|nr:hypothetical protein [Micromonospora ureilytica]RQX18453.1 hypothetical protein DDE19_07850 [Micromonospora ureilytica]